MAEFEPFLVPFDGPAEELRAIIEPALDALGLELVQLHFVRALHKDTVRVMTDRKDVVVGGAGVSMAELEKANRVLSDALDVEDTQKKIFPHAYDLEVGSPGVDRPLTKRSHFPKAAGQRVKVKTKVAIAGPGGVGARSFAGTLATDGDGAIRVDDTAIPYGDIQAAHVVFVFEPPKKPGKGTPPGGKHGKHKQK